MWIFCIHTFSGLSEGPLEGECIRTRWLKPGVMLLPQRLILVVSPHLCMPMLLCGRRAAKLLGGSALTDLLKTQESAQTGRLT